MTTQLLTFTKKGIYCKQGDFYLDPWKPVENAIISHGHSDHSRWGMKKYLAHKDSAPVMKLRLGEDINLQTVEYGEKIIMNGVTVSLHPAGHVIGSAQIRVEHKGDVWVYTGDYKLENDGISTPYEPVTCNTFITESTFGLPIYKWDDQYAIFNEVNEWWQENKKMGKTSVLFAYSLGKAQRILQNVDSSIGPILTHGAVENTNKVFREHGIKLPATTLITKETPKEAWEGGLIIAPPSADGSPWLRKFKPFATGYCSGWMAVRGARRWRAIDRGFVISDHCDWTALNSAVKNSQAESVYVTHGFTASYARWLREEYKLNAQDVQTSQHDEVTDQEDG